MTQRNGGACIDTTGGQSKWHSFMEAVVNTVVGLLVYSHASPHSSH